MCRGFSLCLAFMLSLVGLVFPFLLARHATGLNQSVLLVMMLGIAGALIYGAGFQPDRKWLRALLSPAVTWPVMLLTGVLLLVLR